MSVSLHGPARAQTPSWTQTCEGLPPSHTNDDGGLREDAQQRPPRRRRNQDTDRPTAEPPSLSSSVARCLPRALTSANLSVSLPACVAVRVPACVAVRVPACVRASLPVWGAARPLLRLAAAPTAATVSTALCRCPPPLLDESVTCFYSESVTYVLFDSESFTCYSIRVSHVPLFRVIYVLLFRESESVTCYSESVTCYYSDSFTCYYSMSVTCYSESVTCYLNPSQSWGARAQARCRCKGRLGMRLNGIRWRYSWRPRLCIWRLRRRRCCGRTCEMSGAVLCVRRQQRRLGVMRAR